MGACSRGSRACWPGHHHGAAAPAARAAPCRALERRRLFTHEATRQCRERRWLQREPSLALRPAHAALAACWSKGERPQLEDAPRPHGTSRGC